jgi:tRNA threonylcarbamoyladenosine biosynthesis protein TsaB
MLLAIDTATEIMSLALHTGDTLLAEVTMKIGRNHGVYLAPMVKQLFEQSETSADDLTAMAVSIGPGSYTGLRIGVSLAKGMAAVQQIPLVGISTLDTIAAGQTYYNTRNTLVVVVPAGRGRVISGTYHAKKGQWVTDDEPILQTWDDLVASIDDRIYLTGELTPQGLDIIKAAQDNDTAITLIRPAERLRRAGFLAEVAWQRIRDKADDQDFAAESVIPIYMKSPG